MRLEAQFSRFLIFACHQCVCVSVGRRLLSDGRTIALNDTHTHAFNPTSETCADPFTDLGFDLAHPKAHFSMGTTHHVQVTTRYTHKQMCSCSVHKTNKPCSYIWFGWVVPKLCLLHYRQQMLCFNKNDYSKQFWSCAEDFSGILSLKPSTWAG